MMNWSGVDYLWIIVMFLSAVWTLILTAPIHCGGSIYILDDLRESKFFCNFFFFIVGELFLILDKF